MSEPFDLFGGDLSPAPGAPVLLAPAPVATPLPEAVANTPLHADVLAVPPALNHCLYAFVAQARWHGHTDPSLDRVYIDKAGRSIVDEVEVTRFANELLRGVRSDRPTMTPERWADAIATARGAAPRTEAREADLTC